MIRGRGGSPNSACTPSDLECDRGFLLLASAAPLLTLLVACKDRPTDVPGTGEPGRAGEVGYLASQARTPVETAHLERWNAPWWSISDTDLADSIRATGGQVLIGFKDPEAEAGVNAAGRMDVSSTSVESGKRRVEEAGVTIVSEYEGVATVLAQAPIPAVAELRYDPLIDYVEPNVRVAWSAAAEDTTWNVHRVQAPDAWSEATGSGVRVLILDTGAYPDHPDLSYDVIHDCDLWDGIDPDGHGTKVAGVVAATANSIDVIGVSHDVDLWSSGGQTAANTYCAVLFARTNEVFAVNMSFWMSHSAALTDQIEEGYDEGMFFAAAVGNDTASSVTYPASLSTVVGVTAVDSSDSVAVFANVGSEVELSAPGVSIETTCIPSGTCTVSGTSFATPHVTGAAAILKAANPTWTGDYIRQRLTHFAESLGSGTYYGHGLVQIDDALSGAPPGPSVSIVGPDEVQENVQCTWLANVSGGLEPYTHTWRRQEQEVSTTDSYTTSDTGATNFLLELEVEDADGGVGFDYRTVVVQGSGQFVCDWP